MCGSPRTASYGQSSMISNSNTHRFQSFLGFDSWGHVGGGFSRGGREVVAGWWSRHFGEISEVVAFFGGNLARFSRWSQGGRKNRPRGGQIFEVVARWSQKPSSRLSDFRGGRTVVARWAEKKGSPQKSTQQQT